MNHIHYGEFLTAFIFTCALLIVAMPVKAQRPSQRPTMPTKEDESQNEARTQRQGRLMPPSGLDCDVNHLTSFTGRVLSYSRRAGRIFIRVRTDEATTEEFTINYASDEAMMKRFKLNGETLRQAELSKIESRWRRDRKNTRATVWACYDDQWRNPSAILIDWRVGKPKPPLTL